MAGTKITVNNNGSLRVEGDFEIVDPTGKPFGLAGPHGHRSVPLWPLHE